MLRDLRFALRSQLRDWRFAAMVVLTLAVCIGANTAVFTVVHSVLLQPLPVPGGDSIVLIANRYPKAGVGDLNFSSGADYPDRKRAVPALEDLSMFRAVTHTVDIQGIPEQLNGISATPSLFQLVRTPPYLGRAFTEAEGEIGSEQKVILSHSLWRQLFAGDRAAVGRELRLSGRPYTIVGVMPEGFLFFDPKVRFWIPLAFTAEQRTSYHSNNWYNVGRLKPGVPIERAQAQINALNAENLDKLPRMKEILLNAGFRTDVEPLKKLLTGGVQSTLYLLWAGAALVLLIGGVNIASIVMARTAMRLKEIGTRLALGAGSAQVARQLFLENAVIAAAGGLAGLALAAALLRALSYAGLENMPRAAEVRIDATVVGFALLLALASGIAVAVAPVAYSIRMGLVTVLRDGGRTGSSGRRTRTVRRALVVAQVAFAFVLLTGAGLLLASFRRLLEVDPGFSTARILTAATSAPSGRYAGSAELRDLARRGVEALRAIPGVESASATTGIPFERLYSDGVILAEGYQMKPGESVISPKQLRVTPGYFETLGIRLVSGRDFDGRDTHDAPLAVIVDERLARKFWPGQDPIGRRMFFPGPPDFTRPNERTTWLRVVGVVRSVLLEDLAGGPPSAGVYYVPFAQSAPRSFTFAVRGSGVSAQSLRAALSRVDPALALFDVRTMSERLDLSMSSRRAAMSLALGFGIVALFLSAVGIYGVLSYLLAQRRREIGIRMAVGSTEGAIFRLFLGEGAILVAAGLILGLFGSVALRSAVRGHIYGVQPLDPVVLASASVLLGLIALTACVWPARSASRTDPLIVLNEG